MAGIIRTMTLKKCKCIKGSSIGFEANMLNRFVLSCLLLMCASLANSQIKINPEKTDSISHLRAIPLFLSEAETLPFTRQAVPDSNGYLWTSGSTGILRYDGYETKSFLMRSFSKTGGTSIAFLFTDSDGVLWAGDTSLHRFDEATQAFEAFDVVQQQTIQSIVEDSQGYLWLASDGSGAVKFDKKTMQVVPTEFSRGADNAPIYIHSLAHDDVNNILWIAAGNGIFYLDIVNNELHHVPTQIDPYFDSFFIRDIALDTHN